MNEMGQLVEWNDERGFGFVHAETGERLFVHIKAITLAARRPLVGDVLVFRRGVGRDGRPAVAAARLEGVASRPTAHEESRERALTARALRLAGAALLLAIVLAGQSLERVPDWLLWTYLVMGIVSALCYFIDKRAARAGRWRIPEAKLHGIDFFGGIIGGLLAQTGLHHKTAKTQFAVGTLLIYMIHVMGLMGQILGVFDLPQIPS